MSPDFQQNVLFGSQVVCTSPSLVENRHAVICRAVSLHYYIHLTQHVLSPVPPLGLDLLRELEFPGGAGLFVWVLGSSHCALPASGV